MCDSLDLNEILSFLESPPRPTLVEQHIEPFPNPLKDFNDEGKKKSLIQLQSSKKPNSIREISQRIADVDSLVCQLQKTEGERSVLEKQLLEFNQSVREMKELYENEKQKHLEEKVRYNELLDKCQKLDTDLLTKSLEVDQLQAQCDGLKVPLEYNELAVRYLKFVQKLGYDNLHWQEQYTVKELQKYCKDKYLRIPTIVPKSPRKRKLTISKSDKEVQCDIATSNSKAIEHKKVRNQSTQCEKVATRNQGCQHIGTTTTRSTTTTCFFKYHDVGVGCNILDFNYVLDEMLNDVCSWSNPIAPLSPINDLYAIEDKDMLTPLPIPPTVVSLPPPAPALNIKTIGTCTDLCNVQRPLGFVSQLPIIKRSDSRPPSTTMYDTVKNENSVRSLHQTTNSNPPPSIPNIFPTAFDELWQIFGHMLYGLLHRRTGNDASFGNQSNAPGNITNQHDFCNWIQTLYMDANAAESVQTRQSVPPQSNQSDRNFIPDNRREDIAIESINQQTQNCNVASPLHFSNAAPVKNTSSEQYLFKPKAQKSGNSVLDEDSIIDCNERHSVATSPIRCIASSPICREMKSIRDTSNEHSNSINSVGNCENRTPSAFTSPKSTQKDKPKQKNADQLNETAEEILQLFPTVNNPSLTLQSLQNLLQKNLKKSRNVSSKKRKKKGKTKLDIVHMEDVHMETETAVDFITKLHTFDNEIKEAKAEGSQKILASSDKCYGKASIRKFSKRFKHTKKLRELFGSETDESDSNDEKTILVVKNLDNVKSFCTTITSTEDETHKQHSHQDSAANLETLHENRNNVKLDLSNTDLDDKWRESQELQKTQLKIKANPKIENKYTNCIRKRNVPQFSLTNPDSSFDRHIDSLENILPNEHAAIKENITLDEESKSSDYQGNEKGTHILQTEMNCFETNNERREHNYNIFGSDSDERYSVDEDAEICSGNSLNTLEASNFEAQINLQYNSNKKFGPTAKSFNEDDKLQIKNCDRISENVGNIGLNNAHLCKINEETVSIANQFCVVIGKNDMRNSPYKNSEPFQLKKQAKADMEETFMEIDVRTENSNETPTLIKKISKSETINRISVRSISPKERNNLEKNIKLTPSPKSMTKENPFALSPSSDGHSISETESESKLEIVSDVDEEVSVDVFQLTPSVTKKRGRKRKSESSNDSLDVNAVETVNTPCKRSARLLAKRKIMEEQNIEVPSWSKLIIGKYTKRNSKETIECKKELRDTVEMMTDDRKNCVAIPPILGYFRESSNNEHENEVLKNNESLKPHNNRSNQNEDINLTIEENVASTVTNSVHAEIFPIENEDTNLYTCPNHVIFTSPPASPAPSDNESIDEQAVKEIPLERPEDSFVKRRKKTILHNLINSYRATNYRPINFSQFKENEAIEMTQIILHLDKYLTAQSDALQIIKSVFSITKELKIVAHAICSSLQKLARLPTIPYEIQKKQPESDLLQPVESVIQQKFTNILNELILQHPMLKDTLLNTIETLLFSIHTSNTLSVDAALNLTDLYLLTLKLQESTENPVRLFIAKCLYYHKAKAVPMIYAVLRSYPTTLPHRDEHTYDRSDPLITVIQHTLMCNTYDMSNHELFHRELISALRYVYHFEPFKPDFQTVVQNLFEKIRAGKLNNLKYSFAILCKRLPPERVLRDVINAHMVPLSNEYYNLLQRTTEYDERAATLLECFSTVIKPFPRDIIDQNGNEITNFFNIFRRFLTLVERPLVQEAAVLAILRLQRFDYINCYNALIGFRPDYNLEPHTRAALKTFIQRKPLSFWKTLLSKIV